MKIGFFSEADYTGKISRDNPNIRTDSAWVCAMDATHHPIPTLHQIPDNTYDFGIIIIPKNKEGLYDYPLIEQMKRVCNKIGIMQESTYWYWQGGTVQSQLWYHNILQSMDIIFCHNDMDLKYYKGITDVRCELMPTLMITDHVKTYDGERKGVMVGGNWVTAYRGFDSYIIGKMLSDSITSPTTGRMKPDETLLDINHLPWIPWIQWMYELSKCKYGVQLGTAAAGTFNLNCAYLGIPCIAYDNVNTQKYLHPDLSVPDGDIEQARKLATRLANDEEFYTECSVRSKENYNKLYTEKMWKEKINKLIKDD
jgi:hypothetical protein|tara:strand:+ start:1512 stop:2444 length:933 start_codon:yes stop_codon:yes gene_type:complete